MAPLRCGLVECTRLNHNNPLRADAYLSIQKHSVGFLPLPKIYSVSDNNAKIRISLKDGEFELSGSELFVSQQIASFRELIVESLQKQNFELKAPEPNGDSQIKIIGAPSASTQSNGIGNTNSVGGQVVATHFPRVFHVENGEVKLIKRAPGNNNAQKSVATAVLYVWAKQSLGNADVTYPELRAVCKDQGCLDESNFSAHIKGAKEYIVVEGSGKFQKVKLTLPGKEHALAIIESLNQS